MGFEHGERTWRIPVSDTQAYRQFGNAVVVPVVESIATAMRPHILRALADRPDRMKLQPERPILQAELAFANG